MGMLCSGISMVVAGVAIAAYLKVSMDLRIERHKNEFLANEVSSLEETLVYREVKYNNKIDSLREELHKKNLENIDLKYNKTAEGITEEILEVSRLLGERPKLTIVK